MNQKKLLMISIFASFIWIISRLLYTKEFTNFLHPRMVKFLVFALIILVILTVYQTITFIKDHLNNQQVNTTYAYSTLICFIPILLFSLNPQSISGQALDNKILDIGAGDRLIENVNDASKEEIRSDEVLNEEVLNEAPPIQTEVDLPELQDSTTVPESDAEVTLLNEVDDNFMDVITGLYVDEASYLNQPITLDGFIYREDYLDENTAVVGRLFITCCAADATVIGVLCTSDELKDFESDSWVQIEGILTLGKFYSPYSESMEEVIMIEEPVIVPIEPYESPYVYYDYN